MKLSVVGTGYVGLVSGACFAEFGFNVTCIDCNTNKIDQLKEGEIPIYEPGLDSLVQRGAKQGYLQFTTGWETIADSDIVMLAVGTPIGHEGAADTSAVWSVLESIAPHLKPFTVVVTKSTVPVGTAQKIQEKLQQLRPDLRMGHDIDVASNPEFLREGSAIEDFMRPDRVVVGVNSEKAKEVMARLYRPLFLKETPIVWTNPESSELIKYAANGFLAMKIAFINEIADICEQVGADAQQVAKGMGLDKRIGSKFLNVSPGYGGSCFPKDTLALRQTARDVQTPISLIETVVTANDRRKQKMAERIKAHTPSGVVAILGVTFKPNTDDYRESPSLTIIPELIKAGLTVNVYDPIYNKANPIKDKYFDGVNWETDAYSAAKDANSLVLLTEWNEFRGLDLEKLAHSMGGESPTMLDLRNIYRPSEAAPYFHYISLGRAVCPKA